MSPKLDAREGSKRIWRGDVGVVPIDEMSQGAPLLMKGMGLVLVDIVVKITIPMIIK